jgi:hypothetical protein
MKRKSKLQDTRCIDALDGQRDHPDKVTISDALADCVDFENLYHSDRPDVLASYPERVTNGSGLRQTTKCLR